MSQMIKAYEEAFSNYENSVFTYLKYANELNRLNYTIEKKKMELLNEGKIDGKNEAQRSAQMHALLEELLDKQAALEGNVKTSSHIMGIEKERLAMMRAIMASPKE